MNKEVCVNFMNFTTCFIECYCRSIKFDMKVENPVYLF